MIHVIIKVIPRCVKKVRSLFYYIDGWYQKYANDFRRGVATILDKSYTLCKINSKCLKFGTKSTHFKKEIQGALNSVPSKHTVQKYLKVGIKTLNAL